MKAQSCYEDRDKLQFCSGQDLADFFNSELGDPSPSGNQIISDVKWQKFVASCVAAMENNSPSAAAAIRDSSYLEDAHISTYDGIIS